MVRRNRKVLPALRNITIAAMAGVLSIGLLATPTPAAATKIRVPPGVTAGYLVFDRQKGKTVVSEKADHVFRSASLVKILMALDYLERLGPDKPIPPDELTRIQGMLRRSDDRAMKEMWIAGGRTAMIQRMAPKLGLKDTKPPADPVYWGYTTTSASDMLTIYRYVWEKAHPKFRDLITGNMRMINQCAKDLRDQYFGIPRAINGPWAVKQGWSGYGDTIPPDEQCLSSAPADPLSPSASGKEAPAAALGAPNTIQGDPAVDLKSPLLHTSGLVGGDRYFVIVLTLHPMGTSWKTADSTITALTKDVYAKAAKKIKKDAAPIG